MFYTDVPEHRWLMFGSQADKTADHHSDFDVILSGPIMQELEHPFFADFFRKNQELFVENGGVMDLFLDVPAEHRLVSVFQLEHGGSRGIDAGPAYYDWIKKNAIEMNPFHFMRSAVFFHQRGRDPITSFEQLQQRQEQKRLKWQNLQAA